MDYSLVLAVMMLLVIGILMIHSASTGDNLESSTIWQKQIVWSVLSISIMLGMVLIPFKAIYALSYVIYGLFLVLLLMTELFGSMGGGSERWLALGPIRIQPSEFMKIAAILALARFLSEKKNAPTGYSKVILPALIVMVPTAIVLKQPDLGTSLVFLSILFPMLYWAGVDTVHLFFLMSPALSAVFSAPFIPFFNWITWVVFMFGLLAVLYMARYSLFGMGVILSMNIFAGIAVPLMFNKLKPYQQKRITTFIDPEADPLGAGYQIINSKIAIGSGGLLGKGLGEGRYTELGFLPRAHTDFIFSVVGEEFGFVGAIVILGLIVYIVSRGIFIAMAVKNRFMSIASVGIATVFAFHMFVNVGMVVGIMPVTGLPLLFMSYGGSSCLTSAIMVGLLLNFSVNRYEY